MTRFAEIAALPEWLPHHLDPANDRVLFVRLDRQARQARPFLYDFEPASPDGWCWIGGEEVRASLSAAAPCHFIFHTAFCRSTLLVQALDVEGVATGLSEPAVVQDLADIRDTPFGREMLQPVLELIARPMAVREQVVVKPSNAANPLLPQLLEARPQNRALLMYSQLPTFLRSIAKKGVAGRAWGRRLHRKVERYAPLDLGLDTEATYELTDLQAAGLAWLGQQSHFARLLAADTEGRLLTLDGDVFNASRARTLAALGVFFGLAMDEDRALAMAEAPVFSKHSKQGGDFGAIAAEENVALESKLIEGEIEMVADWVMKVAGRLGDPPVPIGKPLLAQ